MLKAEDLTVDQKVPKILSKLTPNEINSLKPVRANMLVKNWCLLIFDKLNVSFYFCPNPSPYLCICLLLNPYHTRGLLQVGKLPLPCSFLGTVQKSSKQKMFGLYIISCYICEVTPTL